MKNGFCIGNEKEKDRRLWIHCWCSPCLAKQSLQCLVPLFTRFSIACSREPIWLASVGEAGFAERVVQPDEATR